MPGEPNALLGVSFARNCGQNGPTAEQVLNAMSLQIMSNPRPRRGCGVERVLQYNRDWAAAVTAADPDYFDNLAKQQKPQFLWVGCADSRIPANQVVGLAPGEVFVHNNVANVVARCDLNCLSVLQFAIDVLNVEHVIVCGHYRCGGVTAAFQQARAGLVDNWIQHVADVRRRHLPLLESLSNDQARISALCELNAITQAIHAAESHAVQDKWRLGGSQEVHGWIYSLDNGTIIPLLRLDRNSNLAEERERAIADVANRYMSCEM